MFSLSTDELLLTPPPPASFFGFRLNIFASLPHHKYTINELGAAELLTVHMISEILNPTNLGVSTNLRVS